MRHSGVQPAAAAAAVLVLFATGAVTTLGAQDAADWLRVSIVQVVPERFDDYIELQLNEVNPGLQQAGIPWRSVFRTAEFGDSYELQSITPLGDLADYDAGGPLARVMRPDRFQRLADRITTCHGVAPCLRRSVPSRAERRDGRPRQPASRADVDAPDRARTGRRLDGVPPEEPRRRFGEWVSRSVCIRDCSGPHRRRGWWSRTTRALRSWSQPSIIVRAFGDNCRRGGFEELAGVVTSVERAVLRYDPELSYYEPFHLDSGYRRKR